MTVGASFPRLNPQSKTALPGQSAYPPDGRNCPLFRPRHRGAVTVAQGTIYVRRQRRVVVAGFQFLFLLLFRERNPKPKPHTETDDDDDHNSDIPLPLSLPLPPRHAPRGVDGRVHTHVPGADVHDEGPILEEEQPKLGVMNTQVCCVHLANAKDGGGGGRRHLFFVKTITTVFGHVMRAHPRLAYGGILLLFPARMYCNYYNIGRQA